MIDALWSGERLVAQYAILSYCDYTHSGASIWARVGSSTLKEALPNSYCQACGRLDFPCEGGAMVGAPLTLYVFDTCAPTYQGVIAYQGDDAAMQQIPEMSTFYANAFAPTNFVGTTCDWFNYNGNARHDQYWGSVMMPLTWVDTAHGLPTTWGQAIPPPKTHSATYGRHAWFSTMMSPTNGPLNLVCDHAPSHVFNRWGAGVPAGSLYCNDDSDGNINCMNEDVGNQWHVNYSFGVEIMQTITGYCNYPGVDGMPWESIWGWASQNENGAGSSELILVWTNGNYTGCEITDLQTGTLGKTFVPGYAEVLPDPEEMMNIPSYPDVVRNSAWQCTSAYWQDSILEASSGSEDFANPGSSCEGPCSIPMIFGGTKRMVQTSSHNLTFIPVPGPITDTYDDTVLPFTCMGRHVGLTEAASSWASYWNGILLQVMNTGSAAWTLAPDRFSWIANPIDPHGQTPPADACGSAWTNWFGPLNPKQELSTQFSAQSAKFGNIGLQSLGSLGIQARIKSIIPGEVSTLTTMLDFRARTTNASRG